MPLKTISSTYFCILPKIIQRWKTFKTLVLGPKLKSLLEITVVNNEMLFPLSETFSSLVVKICAKFCNHKVHIHTVWQMSGSSAKKAEISDWSSEPLPSTSTLKVAVLHVHYTFPDKKLSTIDVQNLIWFTIFMTLPRTFFRLVWIILTKSASWWNTKQQKLSYGLHTLPFLQSLMWLYLHTHWYIFTNWFNFASCRYHWHYTILHLLCSFQQTFLNSILVAITDKQNWYCQSDNLLVSRKSHYTI
jgi:hypothetical protein